MAATLVPSDFFNPAAVRRHLSEVAEVADTDKVFSVEVPQYGAYMIYSVSGGDGGSLPDLFYVLRQLSKCPEYNKIVVSYRDSTLSLGIAQGSTLLLANEYVAADFTTAQYFIFLALKSLQLNPEVSTVNLLTRLPREDEMSLYRYFKGVENV